MNTISKFKWFWAWQDEKEEAWLAEMAAEGLHLVSFSIPGFYYFQQGEPGNYVYRLDFQTMKSKDRDSYLQLFADAGWEHIGDMGGWVYFRHKVNGSEILDIYSDWESKMGKYYRLLFILVIFLPIMIIMVTNISDYLRYREFMGILVAIPFSLFLLYTLAVVQIFRRMLQIKEKGL